MITERDFCVGCEYEGHHCWIWKVSNAIEKCDSWIQSSERVRSVTRYEKNQYMLEPSTYFTSSEFLFPNTRSPGVVLPIVKWF